LDYVRDWDAEAAAAEYTAVREGVERARQEWEADWNAHFPCTFGQGQNFDMTPYHREWSGGGVSHPLSNYDNGAYGLDDRCKICYPDSKESKMKYEKYERSVDSGQGCQVLIVVNGVVKMQRLESRGNHSYTGDGNPEFVGLPVKKLRGSGFRKVRMSESALQDFFGDPYFA
jgi:hypothetical protein